MRPVGLVERGRRKERDWEREREIDMPRAGMTARESEREELGLKPEKRRTLKVCCWRWLREKEGGGRGKRLALCRLSLCRGIGLNGHSKSPVATGTVFDDVRDWGGEGNRSAGWQLTIGSGSRFWGSSVGGGDVGEFGGEHHC